MKNFDVFTPVLESARKFNKYLYLLGKRGDFNSMINGKFNNSQATNGEVLIYDKYSGCMNWKMVYKNTKGFYFKKNGNWYI